jgi:hypothetical protein
MRLIRQDTNYTVVAIAVCLVSRGLVKGSSLQCLLNVKLARTQKGGRLRD